jgi:hypothetical protein
MLPNTQIVIDRHGNSAITGLPSKNLIRLGKKKQGADSEPDGEKNLCNFEEKHRKGDGIFLTEPDIVKISNIEIHSDEVFRFLKSEEDREIATIQALEAGVAVIERLSSRRELDFLAEKTEILLNSTRQSVTDFISQNLDPTAAGSLSEKVLKIFEIQNNQIREMLCEGKTNVTAMAGQIDLFKKGIEQVLVDTLGKSLNSDQSGVGLLLNQIRQNLQNLSNNLLSAKIKAENNITEKGVLFESRCFSALFDYAKAYEQTSKQSVEIINTTSVVGLTGGKVGDAVARFCDFGQSVVMEFKDEKGLTVPCIVEMSRASLENRAAQKSLFIVPDETYLPREIGFWGQYGDITVTTLTYFPLALKLAVCDLAANHMSTNKENLDVEQLLKEIKNIETTLKRFSSLTASTRQTVKSAEKSGALAEEIRDTIEKSVENLLDMINGGAK